MISLDNLFILFIFSSSWANAEPVKSEMKKSLLDAAKAAGLSKLEIPSNFYIETLQWLPETGLVTDAFKLKRKVHIAHLILFLIIIADIISYSGFK